MVEHLHGMQRVAGSSPTASKERSKMSTTLERPKGFDIAFEGEVRIAEEPAQPAQPAIVDGAHRLEAARSLWRAIETAEAEPRHLRDCNCLYCYCTGGRAEFVRIAERARRINLPR